MPSHSTFAAQCFDLLDDLENLETLDALQAHLSSHFALVGIERFAFTRVPNGTHAAIVPLLLVADWPADWLAQYDAKGWVRFDPVVEQLVTGLEPFFWSDIPASRLMRHESRQIMSEAGDAGLRAGIGIPISDPQGFQGCVSMAGERFELPDDGMRALHMVGLFAFGRAERLYRLSQPPPIEPLTEREREVLRWIATGHAQHEVAARLGISSRTVEVHLSNARTKLRANNSLHAAVKAVQERVIRL